MQNMQRGIFDNWGLKEHVGTIHYNEKKKEICNICRNKFYIKCSMRKQLVMHDASVPKNEKT